MNRREALRELGSGATLGALFGTALVMVQCQPIEAPAAEPDPLLALINEYRAGLAAFNAAPLENTHAEDEALRAVTWEPPYDVLCSSPPAPTSEKGAVEALRLIVEEYTTAGDATLFAEAILPVVVAYFDGRTA